MLDIFLAVKSLALLPCTTFYKNTTHLYRQLRESHPLTSNKLAATILLSQWSFLLKVQHKYFRIDHYPFTYYGDKQVQLTLNSIVVYYCKLLLATKEPAFASTNTPYNDVSV